MPDLLLKPSCGQIVCCAARRAYGIVRYGVYLKESFRDQESVIEYLGRYTHKIAIANHRIVKVEGGEVWFSYKDYRDGNKRKVCRVSVDEFMRRFCRHIVPKRFVRIRYFGLLSHRNKRAALRSGREFYALPSVEQREEYSWQDVLRRVTGIDAYLCPACRSGRLVESFQPKANGFHSPPVPEATA